MPGIHLVSPVTHPSDGDIDIAFVGLNYDGPAVIVRLRLSQSAEIRDYRFGPGSGSIATLPQLFSNVNGLTGLRVALLQYLQTLDSTLAGTVS